MLYDYEMLKPRLPYQTQVIDPYAGISASPETQTNRGRAGGWEEGVSDAGSAVAGAFPIASLFMGAGKMAYKGIKSSDTAAGDSIANLFGPHHTTFGLIDDNQKGIDLATGQKLSQGDKVKNLFASIFSGDPITGMVVSAIRGNKQREREGRIKKMADWAKDVSMAAGYDIPTIERPVPGAKDYANDAMSMVGGIKGLVGMFNKKPDAATDQHVDWNSPDNGGGGGPTYTPPANNTAIPNDFWQTQGLPYENAPDVSEGGQTLSLHEGGTVRVKGGRKERDDIALVDTTTGKDTGVRVSQGEKIVFSEDTLMELSKALKKKDKSAVFNLVKDQVAKDPNKKGGLIRGGKDKGYYPPDQMKAFGYYTPPEENMNVYDENGGLMNSDIYNLQGDPAQMPYIPGMPVRATPHAPQEATHTGVSTPDAVPDTKVADNLSYWLPSIAGTGLDISRLHQGMKGANVKIPKWQRPAEWVRYLDDARNASTMGLSAAEMANLQQESDRSYMYDVDNIYNASGGNAGTVLGNLGRANNQRNQNQLRISSADHAARLENLNRYGSILGNDVNLDRLIFGDAYSEAKQQESAGAQVASDAIANMKERGVVDQFYNPQSLHGKVKGMEVKSAAQTAAEQKAFMKFIRENPDVWSKIGVGTSAGTLDMPGAEKGTDMKAGEMYDEYRAGGGKLSYSDFIKTK